MHKIFFIITVCFSFFAFSGTISCEGEVDEIYVNETLVQVKINNKWKTIGDPANPATIAQLSIILKAVEKNGDVSLTYPDSEDCNSHIYTPVISCKAIFP